MNKAQRYKSVSEMLEKSSDTELRDDFEQYAKDRQAIRCLSVIRCKKGFSQEDIAKKLGCTQSRISKMESGVDADLRLGDVEAYLKAMGLDLNLVVKPHNFTTLDSIKCNAAEIRRHLDELADLSQADDGTAASAGKTFIEVLFNLVKIVADSAEKLPVHPATQQPFCRIELRMPNSTDILSALHENRGPGAS